MLANEKHYPEVDVEMGKRLLIDQANGKPRIRRGGPMLQGAAGAACYARVNNVSRPDPSLIVYGPLTREQMSLSERLGGFEGYCHHPGKIGRRFSVSKRGL